MIKIVCFFIDIKITSVAISYEEKLHETHMNICRHVLLAIWQLKS